METEAEYWKKVALWLAHVQAATAYSALCCRSTSKRERSRQIDICNHARLMLFGNWPAGCRADDNLADTIERLESTAATEMDTVRPRKGRAV